MLKKMEALRAVITFATMGAIVQLATAASFSVGGSGGWDLSSDIQTWTATQKFTIGDSLVFTYSPMHTVMEVSKADYDSCSTSNPIISYTGGNTLVKLPATGKRYFICGTSGHCAGGMKLEINILASTTTPATSKPPTPSREEAPATVPPSRAEAPTTAPPTRAAAPATAPPPMKLHEEHLTPSQAPIEHVHPHVASPGMAPAKLPPSPDLPTTAAPSPQKSAAAGSNCLRVMEITGVAMMVILFL